jgi:hypothetical protein
VEGFERQSFGGNRQSAFGLNSLCYVSPSYVPSLSAGSAA